MAGSLGLGTIVLVAVLVVIVLWAISVYNRLVTLREYMENALSQIDVQLKRRFDLIPNLVESVKGYMKHERETLEAVMNARARAVSAEQRASTNPRDRNAVQELFAADAALTGALGRLLAVVEAYPDLKANQSVAELMEELRSTENRIAYARQHYNDSATRYNITLQKFPTNLIAGMFGFQEAPLYEIVEPEQREAPRVSFS